MARRLTRREFAALWNEALYLDELVIMWHWVESGQVEGVALGELARRPLPLLGVWRPEGSPVLRMAAIEAMPISSTCRIRPILEILA
jgi:hypothetical protein